MKQQPIIARMIVEVLGSPKEHVDETAVTIKVHQGERPMANDNKLLGNFDLVGIPPAMRGLPQIEVTFDIDANGIVNVSAQDKGTGKEQKITITGGSNLDKDEIERMRKEAEEHADADKERVEKAETKNLAETTAFATEKLLSDHADKVDEATKTKLQDGIKALKEAIAKDDTAEMKAKIESLNKDAQEIGNKIYQEMAQQQQAAGTCGTGNCGEEPKEEKVVDAEFEDKKEEEKKE